VEGALFVAAVRGEFIPISVDGRNLPENASRSRNLGVELGATAQPTRWLDLVGSYTFLDLRLRDYKSSVVDATGTRQTVDLSGKRIPGVPAQRITAEARARPADRLGLGVQLEWQGVVYVETGNADRGTWYFRRQPDGPVQGVPFRAVPARTLVNLNAAYRLGRATVFGRVDNLFGARYTGSVRTNDLFGQFYEAGSPTWVSVGIGLDS
jgi:iron complex outermembrane receptor protein